MSRALLLLALVLGGCAESDLRLVGVRKLERRADDVVAVTVKLRCETWGQLSCPGRLLVHAAWCVRPASPPFVCFDRLGGRVTKALAEGEVALGFDLWNGHDRDLEVASSGPVPQADDLLVTIQSSRDSESGDEGDVVTEPSP